MNMHWKVATSKSPLHVAMKQLTLGLLLREASGRCTFYAYKDFPRNSRPATEDELQEETGWTPLVKQLPVIH